MKVHCRSIGCLIIWGFVCSLPALSDVLLGQIKYGMLFVAEFIFKITIDEVLFSSYISIFYFHRKKIVILFFWIIGRKVSVWKSTHSKERYISIIMVYIAFTSVFAFCVISDKSADFWMILQQYSFSFLVVGLFICAVILLHVGGHLFSDLMDKKWGHLKIGFPLASRNHIWNSTS